MPEMRKISSTRLVTKLLSRAFLIKPPQPPAAAAENLNVISFGNCLVPDQETWLREDLRMFTNNDEVVMSNNKDNDDICGLIRKSLQSMTPISVSICRPNIKIPDLNKGKK